MGIWKPYTPQNLPPTNIRWEKIQTTLEKATQAIEKYCHLLCTLPDAKLLLFPLLLFESIASLESQKIYHALDSLLLKRDHTNQPIWNYLAALKYCSCEIHTKFLSKQLLCTAHQLIKTGKKGGTHSYRTRQNWIGPAGCSKEEAYFLPPNPREVPNWMQAWFHYCKQSDPFPLVQIAIAFAQFLIIHPFMDGNGRIARILIPLLLYKKNLLPYPLLFLSRYFQDHRLTYFRQLFAITGDQRWEHWILFFLKGITQEVRRAIAFAECINTLDRTIQKKTRLFLFSHPRFFRSAFLRSHSINTLRKLEQNKMIERVTPQTYVFSELIRIQKSLTKRT